MFQAPRCKKAKLWTVVAKKLNELMEGISSFTGPACGRKWRNLIQTLKKVKDNSKKTGRGRMSWRYYDLMVEVTQTTKAIDPPKDILVSSVDASEAGCTESDDGGTVAVLQEASNQSRKRKRMSDDWLKGYLMEQKVDGRQRWEEAKKLEEEKINVLKNLVTEMKSCKCKSTQ